MAAVDFICEVERRLNSETAFVGNVAVESVVKPEQAVFHRQIELGMDFAGAEHHFCTDPCIEIVERQVIVRCIKPAFE